MNLSWQDSIHEWAAAWAAVRGLDAARKGDAVATVPDESRPEPEYIAVWPGDAVGRVLEIVRADAGFILSLATDDPGGARAFALEHGLAEAGAALLLTAATDSLPQVPDLPEEGNLSLAPLEFYDVAEISVFDQPVATGRIHIADTLAVIGDVESRSPDPAHTLAAAVVAALAGEAAMHGAGTLYTIVGTEQAADYCAAGWIRAAEVISFRAGPV